VIINSYEGIPYDPSVDCTKNQKQLLGEDDWYTATFRHVEDDENDGHWQINVYEIPKFDDV